MKCTLLLLTITGTTAVKAQHGWNNLFESCSVKGSVSIYDFKNDKWFYSDSVDAIKQSLPASTFKIVNSLIALETDVIKDENEIIR